MGLVSGATAPGCWSRGGGHFLASHIYSNNFIISDVLFDIDSDIQSAIFFKILFGIDSGIGI